MTDSSRNRQNEWRKKWERAERLPYYTKSILRRTAIDFGMQFATVRRRRIERLLKNLQTAIEQRNEHMLDFTRLDLDREVFELIREAYLAQGNQDWPDDWADNQSESGHESEDWDTYW
ncbi:MAG: hypothetical protein WBB01_06720 [Phormidesmis sp.]